MPEAGESEPRSGEFEPPYPSLSRSSIERAPLRETHQRERETGVCAFSDGILAFTPSHAGRDGGEREEL